MKRCTFVLIICIALITAGAVAVYATEQRNIPPSIKIGECYVRDYGNGVYFFHSLQDDDSRNVFGTAIARFIGEKDANGYELVTMTAIDKDRGYWVIFRKKPSR